MRRSIPAALLLVAFPCSAWAFRFSPMVAEMAPRGPKAAQTFVIENNGKERIAVQFEVLKRSADVSGKESRDPTDELVVFPDQATLEPGVKRNVKVSWVGAPETKIEKPFRLVVTQLPVDFKPAGEKPSKSGVNLSFLLQYVASIYVVPETARADVIVGETTRVSGSRLKVTLRNQGNAHRLLRGLKLRVGKAKIEVPRKSVESLDSENLLPGATREFTVPLPEGAVPADAPKGEAIPVELELPPA